MFPRHYGDRIALNQHYYTHPFNPTEQWDEHKEEIEVPTRIPFVNESLCGGRPFVLLTAVYTGYGHMAPVRRNPS